MIERIIPRNGFVKSQIMDCNISCDYKLATLFTIVGIRLHKHNTCLKA